MLLVPPRLQPRAMRRAQGGWMVNPYIRASDPHISNTVFLCHADGAHGSTVLTNEALAWGRGGDIVEGAGGAVSTTQYLFGGASWDVKNSTSGWFQATTDVDYAFGSGDFTIEAAYYRAAHAPDVMFDMRPGSNGAYPAFSTNSSGDLFYFVSGATRITGSAVLGTSRWDRVAISRVGTSTRMFVNGVQVGSTWTDTTVYLQAAMTFGASSISIGQTPWGGWIDECRVTKGVGRYVGNYTVADAAFPNE